MIESLDVPVAAPRFEAGGDLLLAGLRERYNLQTNIGIPRQWQRFMPMIGHLPGQVGMVTYGVCCIGDGAGSFDYVCAVEVAGVDGLPPELARLRLAARRYAVFTHAGHLSGLRATVHSIWTRYLPGSGLTVAAAPDFERYGERFDPRSGGGEVEIWIPVQP